MRKSPTCKPRWFQFSLRLLLAFTAMVALACGLMAHQMRRKEKEGRITRALEEMAASVTYDYQWNELNRFDPNAKCPGPQWLRQLLGEKFLAEVNEVNLSDLQRPATNDVFAALDCLPHLKKLFLRRSNVDDNGLVHFKPMGDVLELGIDDTKVSDAGLQCLQAMSQLQVLTLDQTTVSDRGLMLIGRLTQLRVLSLNGTRVDDNGLESLKGLTQLRELHLDETDVGDTGLVNLRGLTQLQILTLDKTRVSDAGLENLKGLIHLEELRLSGSHVSEAGKIEMWTALPKCGIAL